MAIKALTSNDLLNNKGKDGAVHHMKLEDDGKVLLTVNTSTSRGSGSITITPVAERFQTPHLQNTLEQWIDKLVSKLRTENHAGTVFQKSTAQSGVRSILVTRPNTSKATASQPAATTLEITLETLKTRSKAPTKGIVPHVSDVTFEMLKKLAKEYEKEPPISADPKYHVDKELAEFGKFSKKAIEESLARFDAIDNEALAKVSGKSR